MILKKNNPEIYSEVIELKNRLEKDIVNVKEALLFWPRTNFKY